MQLTTPILLRYINYADSAFLFNHAKIRKKAWFYATPESFLSNRLPIISYENSVSPPVLFSGAVYNSFASIMLSYGCNVISPSTTFSSL